MWDPSHKSRTSLDYQKLTYVKEVDSYLLKWGVDYIFSSKYVKSADNFDPLKYLNSYKSPTLIINAGDGVLVESGEDYQELLSAKVKVVRQVIEGADHNFTSSDLKVKLFKTTLKWLNNIKKQSAH